MLHESNDLQVCRYEREETKKTQKKQPSRSGQTPKRNRNQKRDTKQQRGRSEQRLTEKKEKKERCSKILVKIVILGCSFMDLIIYGFFLVVVITSLIIAAIIFSDVIGVILILIAAIVAVFGAPYFFLNQSGNVRNQSRRCQSRCCTDRFK
uniref:Uncharacterized protein n=1 Tax=Strigamia maritima TaxID=126957 RepID=T1II39_STRMM